jgi:WD40 repeat protein
MKRGFWGSGKRLATVSPDEKLILWDLEAPLETEEGKEDEVQEFFRFESHTATINALDIVELDEGEAIATGSANGQVLVINPFYDTDARTIEYARSMLFAIRGEAEED